MQRLARKFDADAHLLREEAAPWQKTASPLAFV